MAKKAEESKIKQTKSAGGDSSTRPSSARKQLQPAKNPKKKKNPKVTRPTDAEAEMIRRRRELVMRLRVTQGANFRAISKALENEGFDRCSPATCFDDYRYMLNLANEEEKLTAEELVEEAVRHLENVRTAYLSSLKTPVQTQLSRMEKRDAADTIISCTKEIAKLRNIYKPKEVKISSDLDFAKALGLVTDELPEPADSSDD